MTAGLAIYDTVNVEAFFSRIWFDAFTDAGLFCDPK